MIKVLIVDDMDIIRKAVRRMLDSCEEINVVGECSDGNEVLDFLHSTKVDVILMDIKMKDVGGIEATKLVKKKYPMIKVIAFTMYNDEIFPKKMMEAGALACLSKNADLNEIREAIVKA